MLIYRLALENVPVDDCQQEKTLVIRICDTRIDGCCIKEEIRIPCQFECRIGELQTEVLECENGKFWLQIKFRHANTGEKFWVTTNVIRQAFGPFKYEDMPVVIGPLPGDPNREVFVTVQDEQNQDCNRRQSIGVVDCTPYECKLYDLEFGEPSCNNDGTISVKMNFLYQNPGSEYFIVRTATNYEQKFKYSDLPVVLENVPVGDDQAAVEFKICDLETDGCCISGRVENPCEPGDCEIGPLRTVVSDCENGAFLVKLDFEHANTSNKFWVTNNITDQAFGPFKYSELPVEIGPLPGNGDEEVILFVRDHRNENCVSRKSLGVVNCEPGECRLHDVETGPVRCSASDLTFGFKLDFEYENVQSEFFVITFENGHRARYKYADLPLRVEGIPLEGIWNTAWFVICDGASEDLDGCCVKWRLEVPCAPEICEIGRLDIQTSDCDENGEFYAKLNFEHARTGEKFFLDLNGESFGEYSYDELPLEIGPLLGDGTTKWHFLVTDVSGECKAEKYLSPIDCDDDCTITQVVVEPHDCVDGTYLVDLEVRSVNGGPLGYYVFADGEISGPYSYSEPTITVGPFPGDGETLVDILVLDIADPSCFGYVEIGPKDCGDRCVIEDIELTALDCTLESTFLLKLEVEAENPGRRGFSVLVNGRLAGRNFSYEEEYVTIGPLRGDGETMYEIVVVDNEHRYCTDVAWIGPVLCQVENVWPGDANSDNIVQIYDLLNVGLAFNATGPARVVDMAGWQGIYATPWPLNFANGLNYMHADCNGDGMVNEEDAAIIKTNYGLSHGAQRAISALPTTDFDPPILAEMPQAGSMDNGASFEIPILLGEMESQVNDIYGIAFRIPFDPDFIDPSSIRIEYPVSWLGEEGVNMITLDTVLAEEGLIEIAMSRIDQNEVSGYGQVAILHGIIDDIAGIARTELYFEGILAINRFQNLIPIRPESGRLEIGPRDIVNQGELESSIRIYPNPTSDWITVVNDYNLPVESLEIFNAGGQLVSRPLFDGNQISLGNLSHGMYFLRMKIGGIIVHKKIIKE